MPYTKRLCTCDICRLEFISPWFEDEDIAEMAERLPGTPVEKRRILCSECYEQFMKLLENRIS